MASPERNDSKQLRLEKARVERAPVDLMEMMREYPEPIQELIVERTQHIEMTDGCTGGCPWCALDVKRKVKEGFTFESTDEFIDEFGIYLPNEVGFYFATDPLDIAGMRHVQTASGIEMIPYDYADLLEVILSKLDKSQIVQNTTSLPLGTVSQAERVIETLHKYWLTGRTDAFRISARPDTRDQIETLLANLERKGLHANYLAYIRSQVEDRTEETRTILHAGNYINHPKRNPFSTPDAMTVVCYDGCLIQTSGIAALTLEAATKRGPFGQTYTKLDPRGETFTLPRYLALTDYDTNRYKNTILHGGNPIKILPEVTLDTFDRQGRLVHSAIAPSFRRDLMALLSVNNAISQLSLLPAHELQPHSNSIRNTMYEYLYQSTQRLMQAEDRAAQFCDDPEALEIMQVIYDGAREGRDTILAKISSH